MKKFITFLKVRFRKWLNEEIWLEDYIKAGMKIGEKCYIQPGVIFDISHAWLIEIKDRVIIAPQAYILAHDTSTKMLTGYTRIGRVIIENGVFIGARAVVLPNVTIGENSIIAAGSVVTSNIPKNSVAAGNPAKVIMSVEDFTQKHKEKIKESALYDSKWYIQNITSEMKLQMIEELTNSSGYIC